MSRSVLHSSAMATSGCHLARTAGRALVLGLVWIAFASLAAPAQAALCIEPGVCDPYTSACSQECEECLFDYPDYYCPQQYVIPSSCGNLGPCLEDNCTPDWETQSSTQIGAFSACNIAYCNYYHCFNIYECDNNECNVNSSYWCRNRKDRDKVGWFVGSCSCSLCANVRETQGSLEIKEEGDGERPHERLGNAQAVHASTSGVR
ncbi:MAG: hypothetical protein HC897_18015, partial [Thermoanaerobaculia bacterium]|nr:hypothetical protein [Thermoanaerobaculia bacterium]